MLEQSQILTDVPAASVLRRSGRRLMVRDVPVARIRPEEGLGRKRDREGHRELQRSIEQFGVLTPITVRPAPDGDDFLLVKGQGRTLACRLLGRETIPAIVVDSDYADAEKVQQFLVENVARLKMRPIDRALLIQKAREEGEETASIAERFSVSPATVRRLLAQLDGASAREVETLKTGNVSLSMHALIAEHVEAQERPVVLDMVCRFGTRTKEVQALLSALGWRNLTKLGDDFSDERLSLLNWALAELHDLPSGPLLDRLRQLAMRFPNRIERHGSGYLMVAG